MTEPLADPDSTFHRHRDEVYRLAMRLLGRHHDANDVVQDVFMRWFVVHRRDAPANPRPWLRRVTINRAIDLIRARNASRPLGGEEITARAERDLQIELRDAIVEALDALTDSQRDVLIAKVLDGRTFAAIAAEQALAIGTVKTHYLRAVRTLRDQLKRRGLIARDNISARNRNTRTGDSRISE